MRFGPRAARERAHPPRDGRPADDTATVLLAAVRAVATDTALPRSAPTAPDWPRAAEAAGLLPVVVDALTRGGVALPTGVGRAAMASAGRHLRAVADLAVLADALDRAGVRWLVFKGPVLSDVVYRRPGLRTYHDLDILVDPEDLGTALDALVAGPATMIDRNWRHIRATRQAEIALATPRGSVVDLHWHVISNPRTRRDTGLDVRLLLDAAQPVTIGGRTVPTLDPVDTVVYVALHAALSGGHRLRWLLDLQQAVVFADVGPDVLRERAARLGALPTLHVMLDRAAAVVDPGLARFRAGLGRRTPWVVLCRSTRWWAHLDVEAGGYSGWALFASTRRSTSRSMRALVSAASVTLRRGKARRTWNVDRSVLHTEGGTDADRRAWIADAARE